jgi:hypothetical protein
VLFELGARPYPPRDLYLAYLRQSDVFIGIYGQQYGWIAPDQELSGLEDEYLNAGKMPKLVYVQSPAPDRDPRLNEMLNRTRFPLGLIHAVRDPKGGEDQLAQAADMFRELDDEWGLAFASMNLGGALLLHHRYRDAIPHLEESIPLARAVRAEVFLSNALINLTLLGAGEGVRSSIGVGVWMTDRIRHAETAARLRARLGDPTYAAATDRGRGLTLDEVLELASTE